jgi:hypothetical protein
MTYTPIVIGSLSWGTPVNNAFTSQDARITDLEAVGGKTVDAMGFLATPYDPALVTSSTILVSGTVYMVRLDVTAPVTFTTSTISVFVAGVTLTAGQNFVGLYDAAGNRVAVTADQSAAWVTVGEKNAAFTAPYVAAAGTYYMAVLSNGTTPIQMPRTISSGAASAFINHNLTTTTARWTTGPTAQTTLPATITMASRTLSGIAFWLGVS